MKKLIMLTVAAMALPAVAHAGDIQLTPETVDYVMKAYGIKCDQTGKLKQDDRVLLTCTSGQKYAVVRATRKDGETVVGVLHWNQLASKWEAQRR